MLGNTSFILIYLHFIMKLRIALFFTLILSVKTLLHADEDTPLEKQMQILARSTKKLSMQVTDSTKQKENITLIESLKQAAIDSQSLEPRKTVTIPTADRAQFLSDFKVQMQKLADTYSEIEENVKAGQYDKAKSLLATLGSLKKEGHVKFKQD